MRASSVGSVLLLAGFAVGTADARGQEPERPFSISLEPAVVVPAEELDAFAGTGFGLGGTLGYALSSRWRLLGHVQWATFGGRETTDPDWTTLSAFGLVGYDLVPPSSPSDLLLVLGGGLVSFDPQAPARGTGPPALETVTPGAALAGLRFAYPLSAALEAGLGIHVVRTIPGDDVIGPDSSWLLSFGGGLTVRP